MIYLTGCTTNVIQPALIEARFGLMCQPGNGYHHRIEKFPFWGADNGCFNDKWVEDEWIDWLSRLPRERCLFAVSPDVYGDTAESYRRGIEYAPIIREMGFPVAVVAQDGAELLAWDFDLMDCVFIGGERTANPKHEWKISQGAEDLCHASRSAGKWVHMGRVNSLRRLERARAMGCHSVDGTYIKHGPDINMPKMRHFLRVLDATPTLPFHKFEGASHPTHREAESA